MQVFSYTEGSSKYGADMKEEQGHLSWMTRGRKKLQDCRIFSVYTVHRESAEGVEGSFIQIDVPDWVTVVPVITDDQGKKRFLMVNQYRHGNETITREFPAGVVEHDEPKDQAAYREMLEETGYHAETLIELGSVSPNPAFMNNRVYTYLALDPVRQQEQNLDEFELIDVTAQLVEDVTSQMGTGIYDNGIMMISLMHYLRWAKKI